MSLISGLPRPNMLAKDGNFTPPWAGWFSRLDFILRGVGNTGTTAQRPTENLWLGQPYFDSTLGYMVWVKTLGPPATWMRWDGTVV